MENQAKTKIEQNILKTSAVISEKFKKYVEIAEITESETLPSLLSAQKTLKDNSSPEIEKTELFKCDPDVKLKFDFTLKKQIKSEENKVLNALDHLDELSFDIIQQCDKIWNVFTSLQNELSFDELTLGSCESFPISRKLEAFDMFKRKFHDDHKARKYVFSYYVSTGDVNKLIQFWNISDLKKAYNELECVLE